MSQIREGLTSVGKKSLFDKILEEYEIEDMEAQMDAIKVLVELLMGQEDDLMELEGSWGDHNSPFIAKYISREENNTHLEIDTLMTQLVVQDDTTGGGAGRSFPERFFSFGEEYVEHPEIDRLLEELMQQDDHKESGDGVKDDSGGVSDSWRVLQGDSAPPRKIQMKISDMFGVANGRKKKEDGIRKTAEVNVDCRWR